mgnify:CR=1 FL=1
MNTFQDIFKSGFLESVTEFSLVDTLVGMAFAVAIGLFIFVVYKKTFAGVMYIWRKPAASARPSGPGPG